MKWLKRLWCKHEVREDWNTLWLMTVRSMPSVFKCYKCGAKITVGLVTGILTWKDEAFLIQTGVIDRTPSKQIDVIKYEDMEVALVPNSTLK